MDELFVPEDRRIQDLEQWLERNALPAPESVNEIEERESLAASQKREEDLFQHYFEKDIQAEERRKRKREEMIEAIADDTTITLQATDGVLQVPLKILAEHCATILTMTHSQGFQDHENQCCLDYPLVMVQEFTDICLNRKHIAQINDDAIVPCIEMAHYLQNDTMVQGLTQILLGAIDTANCLSLCQLADRLNIPVLFERALAHMMSTIGELEENETWDHLTPELRERISTIKAAIQSSVNDKNRLYFASLEEYIAIFAERVQYYKERLAEAEEQLPRYEPHTHAWEDVRQKIKKQKQRLKTLEIAYREQKEMFISKSKY